MDAITELTIALTDIEVDRNARKRAMRAARHLLEDALHAHHNDRHQVVEDHLRQAISLLDR